MQSCPPSERLAEFVAGALASPDLDAVDEHLADCADCRAAVVGAARSSLHEIGTDPTELEATARAAVGETTSAERDRVGTRVGRYVVMQALGRGAMGVVYLAVDSVLHREVALKFVRAGLAEALGPNAQEQLLREGRALAKLTHPNVVVVFDVGVHDGGVFVAMELVAGGDLSSYITREAPPVREILRLFEEAARGLAAVHSAGVVHRDFKPANVLVSQGGTAKVTDFGLAALREQGLTPSLADGSLDAERTESIVGTPAYMAPEQFDGLRAGALADQFGFAVALYEALVGRRPYEGKTVAALSVACRDPKLAFCRGVPRRVQAMIHRGLQTDPQDRFPSMDAVASELRRSLQPRWRNVVYPAIAAGGAAAIVAAATWDPAPPPCGFVAAQIEATWTDEIRRQTQARLEGAPASQDRLLEGLDEYAASVAEAMRRSCVANKTEQTRSDELYDRQMACLETRGEALASLSNQLLEQRPTIDDAIEALVRLPRVDSCEDEQRLLSMTKLPEDEGDRRRIEEARRLLTQADVVDDLGDGDTAMTLLQEATDTLGPLRPSLGAEIACIKSQMLLASGETKRALDEVQTCASQAATAGDDTRLARAWTDRFGIEGYHLGNYELALPRSDMIETMLQRAGDPQDVRALFLRTRGLVLERAGRREEAERDAVKAVGLLRSGDPRELAVALNNLASMHYAGGQWDKARELYAEALELRTSLYGPSHARVLVAELNLLAISDRDEPSYIPNLEDLRQRIERDLGPGHRAVGFVSMNIGQAHLGRGQFAEAVVALERALGVFIGLHGDEHEEVAGAHRLLAKTLALAGRKDEAMQHARKALAIQRKVLPASHPELAWSLEWIGLMLRDEHRYAEALPMLEESLKILEQPPIIHGRLGRMQYVVGLVLRETGRGAQACSAFAAAAKTFEDAEGNPSHRPDALAEQVRCAAAAGDSKQAREIGDRGLQRIVSRQGTRPVDIGEHELALAQAYWDHPPLRDRAQQLERSLETRLADDDEALAGLREQLETWRLGRNP